MIAAIDFAVANRVYLGISVINLSLGHPVFEPAATDPLVQAVERASAAGIVVVVAAGNQGINPQTHQVGSAGINSPANAPSALTVGATLTRGTVDRRDDDIAPFSSRGPTWHDGRAKPDFLAPGESVVAISRTDTKLYKNLKLRATIAPYLSLSGTSMATAVATSVVAMMIEANRVDEGWRKRLTPNTLKALLQFSAIPVRLSASGIPTQLEQGAGAINAGGATTLAKAVEPSAAPGASWMEFSVLPSTTIGVVAYPWAQQIVWGDQVVWGDGLISHVW